MSQAGNDSNNLTKFRSNMINVKFPGQMAINQYSKIFYVFFAFQRSECISIVIYYIKFTSYTSFFWRGRNITKLDFFVSSVNLFAVNQSHTFKFIINCSFKRLKIIVRKKHVCVICK